MTVRATPRRVPTPLFAVDIDLTHKPVRVRVSGELDFSSESSVVALLDWLHDVEAGSVELDLSGVTFIDSDGARPFLEGGHAALVHGQVVVTGERSPAVQALLAALRTADLPPWFASTQAGIGSA